jgi:hypothetical protein
VSVAGPRPLEWVSRRVCALTERVRRWLVTGCDAGAEAHFTGLKRGSADVATAGAYGSQARAGPFRRQRSRG